MIKLAIRIDNRQYKQDQEKKGVSTPQIPQHREPPLKNNNKDIIDLDKIRTGGKGCKILKTKLNRRYKEDAYLYYGK